MKLFSFILAALLMTESSWALSPSSVYNLSDSWTGRDGKQVAFSDLKGKVRIVSMVFTRCSSACPLLVSDIKAILSKLPASEAAKVEVSLFSFDHQRDTPEALREFSKKMKIDSPQWGVYSSTKNTVSELAAVLGVQYKALESGAYVHSNNIILLNKEGEILKSIEGYNSSVDDFIALLKKSLQP